MRDEHCESTAAYKGTFHSRLRSGSFPLFPAFLLPVVLNDFVEVVHDREQLH